MDKIVRVVMEGCVGGVQMSITEVRMVLFADDVMLLTERKEDMANINQSINIKVHHIVRR